MRILTVLVACAIVACSSTTKYPGTLTPDALGDMSEDIELIDPSIDTIGEVLLEDTKEVTEEPEPDVPCTVWYLDDDGDGWGIWESYVCTVVKPDGYAAEGGDCCDSSSLVYPDQEIYFKVPYYCPEESWDYNCDTTISYGYADEHRDLVRCQLPGSERCYPENQGWRDPVPNCGQIGIYVWCNYASHTGCLWNEVWQDTMSCR